MFESLFAALDSFEEGMAKKTLKSRREITGLLTTIENQCTTLMQQGVKLPQGARSILTRLKRITHDALTGVKAGQLEYRELRIISRDKIGQYNTALKLNNEKALTAEHKSKLRGDDVFEEDDGVKYASMNAVEKKILDFNKILISLQNAGDPSLRNSRLIGTNIEKALEGFKKRLTQMSERQLAKLDLDDIAENFTLEELATISLDDLTGENSEDDDLKKLSDSYKKFYSRLPVKLKDPFAAFKYPIVPLFKDVAALMDNGKLERAGFKVTRIGEHYLVLEDQHLLALDMEKLGMQSGLRVDRKGRMKSVKGASDDNDPNSPVGRVLAAINKHSPIQYAPASSVLIRNPRNPKIALMWIVPERNRVALERTLRTTEVVWDIPRSTLEE